MRDALSRMLIADAADVAFLLAACGSSTPAGKGTGPDAGSTAPIRVGYLVPLTGTTAANGQDQERGFDLGLQQFGHVVNGHPIQVTYLDSGSSPVMTRVTFSFRAALQRGSQSCCCTHNRTGWVIS